MGLAIDTSAQCPFVLTSDKGKPEEEQPTLFFRYPSYRQFKEVSKLLDESVREKDDEIVFSKIIAAVTLLLAGWRNFPVPYDPDQLESVLSIADLWDLRERLLTDITLSELDRKKSASPSPSNTEASANAAATGTANAETAQPKAA